MYSIENGRLTALKIRYLLFFIILWRARILWLPLQHEPAVHNAIKRCIGYIMLFDG